MKKLLILALAATLSSVAFSQVINGGFETGDFTGWTPAPASSGSLFGVHSSTAHTGTYSAFFAAISSLHDTIFQNVAVTNGASYVLSLWMKTTVNSGDENIQIKWEGNTVFSGAATPTWSQYSFNVTAHSGSAEIRILGYDGPDDHHVDDVALTPVPEPATFAVFGLGVAAIGLLRRRIR